MCTGTRKRILLLILATMFWSSNPIQAQACSSATRKPTSASEAQDYLMRFGYLSVHDLWKGNGNESMSDAILIFQEMAHLNQTGILDSPTYEMMRKERCGNIDVSETDHISGQGLIITNISQKRRRRFARQETQWHRQHLTYRIMKYTPDLTPEEVDNTIAAAFKVWADVTPLTFTPSTCDPVDIEIKFASGDHGDGNAFDGQWGTLGHAYFPYDNTPGINGDTHFDEAETWVLDDSDDGANLLYTAAHEFGHSLGLLHSEVKESLMWPWAGATRTSVLLSQDDIDGIQSIYGKPEDLDSSEPLPITNCSMNDQPGAGAIGNLTTTTLLTSPITSTTPAANTTTAAAAATTTTLAATTIPPTSSTTGATTTTAPTTSTTSSTLTTTMTTATTTTPEPCSGKVDAITETIDGRIYAFRDNEVWSLNQYGVDPGFPKPISSVFPGAPSVVDAAVTVKLKGKHGSTRTFLISGTFVWRYTYRTVRLPRFRAVFELENDFPRSLNREMKVSSNKIDAAFTTGGKKADKVYLVDGNVFWEVKFDKKGKPKAKRQPLRKSKLLSNVPRLDAAFHWNAADKTYFFSKEEYYRYSPAGKKGSLTGPRDTGVWWFECPENGGQLA